MDLGIMGITDIILILGALLMIFIGYKKGFMNKALSLIGALLLFAFAAFYSIQLAGLMKSSGFIYSGIYDTMLDKIQPVYVENERFAVTLEHAFKIHSAIATILAFIMGNPSKSLDAAGRADVAAFKTTIIIAFLIIYFVGLITLIILKIIAKNLRESKFVRVVDGIFGILLYLSLYAFAVLVIFFILDLIYKNGALSGFNKWLETDLQLGTNKFRISKYFFENNFFVMIKDAFLG
ncbi:MAG: hypothetical protein IKN46_02825 [Acholeplasmatales bacterium]|nr:hypothetical protein [Acholeplasmatales bacterium]